MLGTSDDAQLRSVTSRETVRSYSAREDILLKEQPRLRSCTHGRNLIFTQQLYSDLYLSNAENIFQPNDYPSRVCAWTDKAPDISSNHNVTQKDGAGSGSPKAIIGGDASDFCNVVPTKIGAFQVLQDISDVQKSVQSETAFSLFHVRQTDSQCWLLVSKLVFEELMRAYHIFDRFKDTLLHLGSRDREVEISPPQFQRNILVEGKTHQTNAGFECCYGLRYVQINGRCEGLNGWSLRQFAVYNRTEYKPCRSRWLFISLPAFAQEAFSQYHGSCGDEIPSRPFDVHYIVQRKAVAQWRPYLAELTKVVDEHALKLQLVTPDGPVSMPFCDWNQRRQLKRLEDKILDMILVLAATKDTLEQTMDTVTLVSKHASALSINDASERSDISSAFHGLIAEVGVLQRQAQGLRDKMRNTSEAVSTFLELKTACTMEGLAHDAAGQNVKMGKLTAKSAHDAAAVKVLTVITLIYLPTTVVSNFFSTSFVETKARSNYTTGISILPDWWIFVAVSLPLTLLTFGIWWLSVKLQDSPESDRCLSLNRPARFSRVFRRLRSLFSSNPKGTAKATDNDNSSWSSPTLC